MPDLTPEQVARMNQMMADTATELAANLIADTRHLREQLRFFERYAENELQRIEDERKAAVDAPQDAPKPQTHIPARERSKPVSWATVGANKARAKARKEREQ